MAKFRDLAGEFGFVAEELGAMQDIGSMKGANAMQDIEKDVTSKLDRSAKLDEIDTITFGLETDDGKIVKVFVKAEQAEDFEKELGEQLGKSDSIEDVLNELSKKYEIVDVEWPQEGDAAASDEEGEDDGSSAMNKKVYDNPKEREAEGHMKAKLEDLNFGERASLQITEADGAGPIEARLTTPAQQMIYHAIIELGIPEIALNKSPYRAGIVLGIKQKALDLQRSATMKQALKMFISKSSDFDGKAQDAKEKMKGKDDKKNVKEALGDEEQDKDAKIDPAPPKPKNAQPDTVKWEFKKEGENVIMSCDKFSINLDSEEAERLVKAASNHDNVVVKDVEGKKFVFSPRGPNILVKKLKDAAAAIMSGAQINKLFDVFGEKPAVAESLAASKIKTLESAKKYVQEANAAPHPCEHGHKGCAASDKGVCVDEVCSQWSLNSDGEEVGDE